MTRREKNPIFPWSPTTSERRGRCRRLASEVVAESIQIAQVDQLAQGRGQVGQLIATEEEVRQCGQPQPVPGRGSCAQLTKKNTMVSKKKAAHVVQQTNNNPPPFGNLNGSIGKPTNETTLKMKQDRNKSHCGDV